jgi:transcription elongation factor GreB
MTKFPLTPAGYDKLKTEWEDLKFNQRPTVQAAVTFAAAQGDRSENADYTYGKMKIRDIDKRLRYLDRILQNCVVISEVNEDSGIRFGATVHLLNQNSQKEQVYTLVGAQEMDPLNGKISLSSPIGKALVGQKIGDRIVVPSPKGELKFEILKIQYLDQS